MYLTLTPLQAAEFANSVQDTLTANETKFLLSILVALVIIVGALVGMMWNAQTNKLNKLDDTMTASLQNQAESNVKIDNLEKRVEKHDGRILTVERKLGAFMSPPGRGLQEDLG